MPHDETGSAADLSQALTPAVRALADNERSTPPSADKVNTFSYATVLRNEPPGAWGADVWEQVNNYKGAVALAVRPIMTAFRGAEYKVLRRKPQAVRKAQGGRHKWSRDDAYEPVEDHPLCDILRAPGGPKGAWSFGYECAYAYLQYLLTGNAAFWLPSNADGKPCQVFALTTTSVQVAYWPGASAAYPQGAYRVMPYATGAGFGSVGYMTSTALLPGEEVRILREPDPLSRQLGRSRLRMGAMEIDVLKSINEFRWNYFDTGVALDTVVSLPGADNDTVKRVGETLTQKHGGARNARRLAVFGGAAGIEGGKGATIQNLSPNAKDLDFPNGFEQALGQVLAFFGVPKILAGFDDSSNYATYIGQKRRFYQECLLPEFAGLSEFLTKHLAEPWSDEPGEYVIVAEPEVPEDLEQEQQELQFAVGQGLITVNEYRKSTGREEVPDGDLPASVYQQKVQQTVAPPPQPGVDPNAPPGTEQAAPVPGAGGAGAGLPPDQTGTAAAPEGDDSEQGTQDATLQAALAALGMGGTDAGPVAKGFDPNEKRDESGKWTSGGALGAPRAGGFDRGGAAKTISAAMGHELKPEDFDDVWGDPEDVAAWESDLAAHPEALEAFRVLKESASSHSLEKIVSPVGTGEFQSRLLDVPDRNGDDAFDVRVWTNPPLDKLRSKLAHLPGSQPVRGVLDGDTLYVWWAQDVHHQATAAALGVRGLVPFEDRIFISPDGDVTSHRPNEKMRDWAYANGFTYHGKGSSGKVQKAAVPVNDPKRKVRAEGERWTGSDGKQWTKKGGKIVPAPAQGGGTGGPGATVSRPAGQSAPAPAQPQQTGSGAAPQSGGVKPDAHPGGRVNVGALLKDPKYQGVGPFGPGGNVDKVSNAVTARIAGHLAAGGTVTAHYGSKKVPIVAIKDGMMQDAKGQRWGMLSLAAEGENGGVEFHPPASKPAQGVTAAAPKQPAPGRDNLHAQILKTAGKSAKSLGLTPELLAKMHPSAVDTIAAQLGLKPPEEHYAPHAAAVPLTPQSKTHLERAHEWADGMAQKHAARVAQHLGVRPELAQKILSKAIRQVAEHALKNGGKASGTLSVGGKQLRVGVGKPGDAASAKTPPARPLPSLESFMGKPTDGAGKRPQAGVGSPSRPRAEPVTADWEQATSGEDSGARFQRKPGLLSRLANSRAGRLVGRAGSAYADLVDRGVIAFGNDEDRGDARARRADRKVRKSLPDESELLAELRAEGEDEVADAIEQAALAVEAGDEEVFAKAMNTLSDPDGGFLVPSGNIPRRKRKRRPVCEVVRKALEGVA